MASQSSKFAKSATEVDDGFKSAKPFDEGKQQPPKTQTPALQPMHKLQAPMLPKPMQPTGTKIATNFMAPTSTIDQVDSAATTLVAPSDYEHIFTIDAKDKAMFKPGDNKISSPSKSPAKNPNDLAKVLTYKITHAPSPVLKSPAPRPNGGAIRAPTPVPVGGGAKQMFMAQNATSTVNSSTGSLAPSMYSAVSAESTAIMQKSEEPSKVVAAKVMNAKRQMSTNIGDDQPTVLIAPDDYMNLFDRRDKNKPNEFKGKTAPAPSAKQTMSPGKAIKSKIKSKSACKMSKPPSKSAKQNRARSLPGATQTANSNKLDASSSAKNSPQMSVGFSKNSSFSGAPSRKRSPATKSKSAKLASSKMGNKSKSRTGAKERLRKPENQENTGPPHIKPPQVTRDPIMIKIGVDRSGSKILKIKSESKTSLANGDQSTQMSNLSAPSELTPTALTTGTTKLTTTALTHQTPMSTNTTAQTTPTSQIVQPTDVTPVSGPRSNIEKIKSKKSGGCCCC